MHREASPERPVICVDADAFYRRFEIDPNATTSHAIPHRIMRRPSSLPLAE
ncbi:MAG: hypothetical protein V4759_10145 [Pseudomonadota bacterium]